MLAVGHSPIVRRRRLGAELRRLRETAALTGDQLAARVGWSSSKISRIENARVRPEVGDVMDLLDELGVTGAKREEMIAIARDAASTRGWWRAYGDDMSLRQRGWAELEAGATAMREYQQALVPGVLQTPEYARVRAQSMVASGRQNFDVETMIAARQARQTVLTRGQPKYEGILDEAALRRRSAPPGVLAGQIRHLVAMSKLPNITLRVLRHDAELEAYVVIVNSFTIHEFADPADPTIVSVETETSDLHLGDEEDVSRYILVFERVRAAALPPEESVEYLAALADGS